VAPDLTSSGRLSLRRGRCAAARFAGKRAAAEVRALARGDEMLQAGHVLLERRDPLFDRVNHWIAVLRLDDFLAVLLLPDLLFKGLDLELLLLDLGAFLVLLDLVLFGLLDLGVLVLLELVLFDLLDLGVLVFLDFVLFDLLDLGVLVLLDLSLVSLISVLVCSFCCFSISLKSLNSDFL
jgi:hypothetical protein